jgi:hypothetical protein
MSSDKPPLRLPESSRDVFDLAEGVIPADVDAWLRARLLGRDVAYGFGRGGEDRASPHLMPAAAYRRGSLELRAAIFESISGILRQRPLAPELQGALDVLRVMPVASARDDVQHLLDDGVVDDGGLLDRVAAVLGLLGPTDEAYWADLVRASPRPAVVQAGMRALGRFDAAEAVSALSRWLEIAGVDRALPAVGLILPALRKAWTEQHPGQPLAAWWRVVDRLPVSALAAMEPTLTLLRAADTPENLRIRRRIVTAFDLAVPEIRYYRRLVQTKTKAAMQAKLPELGDQPAEV